MRGTVVCGLVCAASGLSATPGTKLVQKDVANKKQERRRIMKDPNFFRSSGDFAEEKEAVDAMMLAEMKSSLLDDMRAGSFETTKGEGNAAVSVFLSRVRYSGHLPVVQGVRHVLGRRAVHRARPGGHEQVPRQKKTHHVSL